MRTSALICILVAIVAAGCPTHRLLRETPVRWNVDLEAVEREHYLEALTHCLPEGLVVYMKRPPGDAAALYLQGTVQADGAYFNGYLLAVLSFKASVTDDAAVVDLAKRTWDAHHLLVAGSGYPGLVARSFGKTAPDSPDLKFRRDGSGDQLIGWLFGTAVFVSLIDDAERRAQAAADLKAIARHLRKHDLKIYMGENEPTPHGDFRTPVFGVSIGHYAIAALAVATLAVRLNPGDAECESFFAWLVEKNYPRQVRAFYPWFPHAADNTCAYCLNLFTVWSSDESPRRRAYYRDGADAMWARAYDWQIPLYALVYRYVGGDDRRGAIRDSIDRLRNLPPYRNRLVREGEFVRSHAAIVPLEDRPMTSSFWTSDVFEELTTQDGERDPVAYTRLDFLLAYWLGRWLGEYGGGYERSNDEPTAAEGDPPREGEGAPDG